VIVRSEAGIFAGGITTVSLDGELASFLGGLAAAEGSFNRTLTKFRFAIALAEIDAGLCEMAAAVLGTGRIYNYARRQPHFHDEVLFVVRPIKELVEKVVPFMDIYLPISKKRKQYLAWREELFHHWENAARRRRVCTAQGCGELQRGKGLCRRHYYLQYRR
jgi:LAGLIDADG DNA endonuclease family protein